LFLVAAMSGCDNAHGEVFVSKRRMEEMVVGSTSSASNVYEAANNNTNPYRNMVMDAMRMNQGNVSQCPIVEEEPNADAARFFDLLKDFDEPLWDSCTNHSKLSAVAQVFTIKSDHGLSEAGYDKIIEWVRSILPERNRLKENFYAAKSMMKPLGLGYQKIDMCPNFCMLYYLENAEMTECMTCGLVTNPELVGEFLTDNEKYGGQLKILVRNSKITDGILKRHRRTKLK